ncbi:Hypothetical predicted protein, partial [Paramuricea clavata]
LKGYFQARHYSQLSYTCLFGKTLLKKRQRHGGRNAWLPQRGCLTGGPGAKCPSPRPLSTALNCGIWNQLGCGHVNIDHAVLTSIMAESAKISPSWPINLEIYLNSKLEIKISANSTRLQARAIIIKRLYKKQLLIDGCICRDALSWYTGLMKFNETNICIWIYTCLTCVLLLKTDSILVFVLLVFLMGTTAIAALMACILCAVDFHFIHGVFLSAYYETTGMIPLSPIYTTKTNLGLRRIRLGFKPRRARDSFRGLNRALGKRILLGWKLKAACRDLEGYGRRFPQDQVLNKTEYLTCDFHLFLMHKITKALSVKSTRIFTSVSVNTRRIFTSILRVSAPIMKNTMLLDVRLRNGIRDKFTTNDNEMLRNLSGQTKLLSRRLLLAQRVAHFNRFLECHTTNYPIISRELGLNIADDVLEGLLNKAEKLVQENLVSDIKGKGNKQVAIASHSDVYPRIVVREDRKCRGENVVELKCGPGSSCCHYYSTVEKVNQAALIRTIFTQTKVWVTMILNGLKHLEELVNEQSGGNSLFLGGEMGGGRYVENLHAIGHFKNHFATALQYAQNLANTVYESIKRVVLWSAYYYTHSESNYPVLRQSTPLNAIPKLDHIKAQRQLNRREKELIV